MAECVIIPMGPACVNITGIRAGDRNLITGHISESPGVDYDLTGLTLTAMARKVATDASPAVTATVTVVGDPEDGNFTIRWPGSQVRTTLGTSKKWKGVWDLQASNGVDDPSTLMSGSIEFEMDVTRP